MGKISDNFLKRLEIENNANSERDREREGEAKLISVWRRDECDTIKWLCDLLLVNFVNYFCWNLFFSQLCFFFFFLASSSEITCVCWKYIFFSFSSLPLCRHQNETRRDEAETRRIFGLWQRKTAKCARISYIYTHTHTHTQKCGYITGQLKSPRPAVVKQIFFSKIQNSFLRA